MDSYQRRASGESRSFKKRPAARTLPGHAHQLLPQTFCNGQDGENRPGRRPGRQIMNRTKHGQGEVCGVVFLGQVDVEGLQGAG